MKCFNLIKYIIDYLVSESMVGTKLSIQAAHGPINPSELLEDAIYPNQKEIERCWTSDHYMHGGIQELREAQVGHGWVLL